jgi:hypothetical protein|nr:MAG TPA: hypothetical protein [Caudoviricetes sp.]
MLVFNTAKADFIISTGASRTRVKAGECAQVPDDAAQLDFVKGLVSKGLIRIEAPAAPETESKPRKAETDVDADTAMKAALAAEMPPAPAPTVKKGGRKAKAK